jgi:hypothetical protein
MFFRKCIDSAPDQHTRSTTRDICPGCMLARDVVGRTGQRTQIWHEICCNSLKRRAQGGWHSIAVYRPHVSHFSSAKDPCTMLVIGPSLPVLRYLWSFSRSRQPLLRHWQFRPRKLATYPFPLSTWRYGAVHMSLCTGRWDMYHPDIRIRLDASKRRNLSIPRHSYAYSRRSGRAMFRWVESTYGAGLTFYFTLPGSITRYGGEWQPGDSPD